MKRNESMTQPQRQHSVTLPPLNLSRMESSSRSEMNNCNNNKSSSDNKLNKILDASQTILFTSTTLQRIVERSIHYTGNDSLYSAFSSTLQKSKASTEKLVLVHDQIKKDPEDIIQSTVQCIFILKELCFILRTRLSILVQGLDTKFSRNLLVNLYSATVDIKEAYETIQPYIVYRNRNKSFSGESPLLSPLSSPNNNKDNTQLYTHLRSAVTGSLHVLNTLRLSIEETKNGNASLEKKLLELKRQAHNATELCYRLDKNVEANMGKNKDDLLLLPTRQESSRRIWEDTSIYLKAIVSVMTFIRAISTEEEFVWPKSIKQGCLYVTRMTAEVAKLWNNYSTFAEDGFYLGRHERSASISSSEQQQHSPSCHSPSLANDIIPMQRRNTQQ